MLSLPQVLRITGYTLVEYFIRFVVLLPLVIVFRNQFFIVHKAAILN